MFCTKFNVNELIVLVYFDNSYWGHFLCNRLCLHVAGKLKEFLIRIAILDDMMGGIVVGLVSLDRYLSSFFDDKITIFRGLSLPFRTFPAA